MTRRIAWAILLTAWSALLVGSTAAYVAVRQTLLAELDRTRRWMLLLGRMNAEQKVATFLLEMADRLAPSTCGADVGSLGQMELPLSRQQIADVLGLTIETVSRQLSKMRSENVIDLPSRREVVIVDRGGLEDRAA